MEQNEDSRLMAFRQMSSHIRESREWLVVGIDVAKERHHAFFGTVMGKTLHRGLVFDNDHEEFAKLLCQADSLKTREGLARVVFGLEPTADYHKPLGEYLITHGQMAVLVAGSAVKKNRELLDGRLDKHDTKDAANVADLISQGKCLFYEYPLLELRELRGLLSLKRRLKKQAQGHRVRIRSHLIAQYFPEMDAYFSYGEGPAIVRHCLNPRTLAQIPFHEFARMVSSRNGGEKQVTRLKEIHQRAMTSIGCSASPAVPFEAGLMLDALEQIKAMTKAADTMIARTCTAFPEYPSRLSIPGFGPDVSAKVLGAIGNPYRFENSRQVLKTAGLDLSADRSGKRTEGTPVISRKGKVDLRYGLYQAALIASTRNAYFIQYITHRLAGKERERGIGTKMRVKLAAKMLVIAWTLMKKEVFDPGCIAT
jgi:transposase